MLKRTLSVFLTISLTVAFVVPPGKAYAAALPAITAKSAVLLAPGREKLLYSKTPFHRQAPASTTKILTAMVVLDKMSLKRVITIPQAAEAVEPSKVYLKAGEQYYVGDLVKAMLISSANDAAEVLGIATSGSRAGFAKAMNKKARSLGATRSNFVNPHGLPAQAQVSTAYDMALIMKAAQRYPFIMEAMKTRQSTISSRAGRTIHLRNHNKMLWKDSRQVIGKTGWTRAARHCFVGSVAGSGRTVFVAMLGSHRLWKDLKILIDYQFGSGVYKISKNRKLWSRRETKAIQTALKRAGYDAGPADGVFGPATLRAVRQFQTDHGLKADAIVGPETMQRLKANSHQKRDVLKRVQGALEKAGYSPGPLDGIFGAKSIDALKSFQKAHAIEPDGVLGTFTLEKLEPYL